MREMKFHENILRVDIAAGDELIPMCFARLESLSKSSRNENTVRNVRYYNDSFRLVEK